MKTTYDLSTLHWTVSGWVPHYWRLVQSMEIGAHPDAEVQAVPASVPGSVQKALLEAGIVDDWNYAMDYRKCQWVENLHWIYEARLPDAWVGGGSSQKLVFESLDFCGWMYLNGALVAEFANAHVPVTVDLTGKLADTGNVLRVVFDHPPRWLGQFGFTSQMRDWKARFNYTWDWTVRLVQTGIVGSALLECGDGFELGSLRVETRAGLSPASGWLSVIPGEKIAGEGVVAAELKNGGEVIARGQVCLAEFNGRGIELDDLDIQLWWPTLDGSQPLYELHVTLYDKSGDEQDTFNARVGFRDVTWQECEGACEGADPWICVVNGKPVFLQGANWVPLLPNYADVSEARYRKTLELYKELGVNVLRVWGGASIERPLFYDLCDDLGILVWQEFPLSSSGVDNIPPDDEASIEAMASIVESYADRLRHHACLILWSGGNELQTAEGPCNCTFPMIARQQAVIEKADPGRRFVPTSSSGPRFCADERECGQGLHWDVHGPWKCDGGLDNWRKYWRVHDALFRSETGAPGTSSARLIRKYSGCLSAEPLTAANPIWRRTSGWWLEFAQFETEMGHAPVDLDEYVNWSQERQAEALRIAATSCKSSFPRCGGFIVWMGHDCFPCLSNTAIIDFETKPKPAALALAKVFHASPADLASSTEPWPALADML